MPRGVSITTIDRIKDAAELYPERLGPRLGVLVMEANIPAAAVAKVLQTTDTSLYRWFYGEVQPHPHYHTEIDRLTQLLKRAKRLRRTPVKGTFAERSLQFRDLLMDFK